MFTRGLTLSKNINKTSLKRLLWLIRIVAGTSRKQLFDETLQDILKTYFQYILINF